MNIEEMKVLARRFQGYADASNLAGFVTPEVDEVVRILPGLIRDHEELMAIREKDRRVIARALACEFGAVIKMANGKHKKREMIMTLKNRKPFRGHDKGAYRAVKARIDAMLDGGVLAALPGGQIIVTEMGYCQYGG